MIIRDAVKIKYEMEKIKKQVINWYDGKERYLNVISPPYNSCEIFLDIIEYVAANKGKILYISNDLGCLQIISSIKNKTNFRDYTLIKNKDSQHNSSLVIWDLSSIGGVDEEFDLIIYDNISGICSTDYKVIKDVCHKHCAYRGKIIFFAIEPIIEGYSEINIPLRKNGKPVVEPTIFFTRLNINKNIPYVVYEYLNWSININKKIIIYVPDKEKVNNLYSYLTKLKNKLNSNVDYFIENISDIKVLTNFSKKKKAILVTNYFGEKYLEFNNINIMICFADDENFDYKRLVYLTGRSGFVEQFEKGEVIFLAKRETNDMAKAKSITRNFNKEAWEMGLLSI
ncbi:hypothetical protein [Haloimpatiens lingqiaonensis]|uniref:hypothetical protein n=1 Tax=Haloimpatiens lingqiaonensis TaxID=1380675 RepID=UPI0010FE9A0B|nr:hypothetical protein [Haloimpatiens lingqiaonensis]